MPRQDLTEAQKTVTATPIDGKPGKFLIQLITPGWGASGYYSPEVLEAAAKAEVFPAGLQMYLDHPMGDGSGIDERGNRSVKDLAASLSEAAVWTGEALVGEANVFGPYRQALTEMKDSIGVSIRAAADVDYGEAEGRQGIIVQEIVHATSADFVTRAGRGGKILQVIESAQRDLDETANDTREALDTALRERFGGEKSWVGVRDFDESTAWFWWSTPDSEGCYQLTYSLSDSGAVELDSGDPTEVRPRTTYVPVHPAGRTPTQESEEDHMGTIQVDEAEHRRLTETAGRVQTLESERDAAVQRAETAESERDQLREAGLVRDRVDAARRVIGEAAAAATPPVTFTPLEERGLLAELPVQEGGELDAAAFRTACDEAAAAVAEAAGAGRPRGFGRTKPDQETTLSESDLDKLDADVFGEIKEG